MFTRGKVGSVLLGVFPGVFPRMLVVVCVGGVLCLTMATLGHPLPSRRHHAHAILPAHLAFRTSRPARFFPALASHFLRVGMALYHPVTR